VGREGGGCHRQEGTKDVTSGGDDFQRTDADRCGQMEASVECIGSGIH